jgi:hypothetical protein
MGRVAVASWTALLLSTTCLAEQRPDPKYTPNLARPAYVTAEPVVAIDQAHHNLHTLDGRYAPFGKLLAADGYRIGPFVEPFSAESLRGVDVLVIANARSSNPGMSAFGRDEIVAVQDWVNQGGSLLLISDHAPFGTAASHLAEAFKVDMGAGFVVARTHGSMSSQILFQKGDLGQHPIIIGRDPSEHVHSVLSFTGQSLGLAPGIIPLLELPPDALEVPTSNDAAELSRGRKVPARSAAGRAQAVALTFGKGRVVIAGEAAMFTEQLIPGHGRVGLHDYDDQQFALNTLHWLSKLI